MGTSATAEKSRFEGRQFEDLFYKQAQIQGYFIEKNLPSARIGWNGRPQIVPGELDWKLIHCGQVGFYDTKTFEDGYFVKSQIKPHQIERAALLSELGVPSGFVVWFRSVNAVVLFKGDHIKKHGPRFTHDQGVELGGWSDFSMKALFP